MWKSSYRHHCLAVAVTAVGPGSVETTAGRGAGVLGEGEGAWARDGAGDVEGMGAQVGAAEDPDGSGCAYG